VGLGRNQIFKITLQFMNKEKHMLRVIVSIANIRKKEPACRLQAKIIGTLSPIKHRYNISCIEKLCAFASDFSNSPKSVLHVCEVHITLPSLSLFAVKQRNGGSNE